MARRPSCAARATTATGRTAQSAACPIQGCCARGPPRPRSSSPATSTARRATRPVPRPASPALTSTSSRATSLPCRRPPTAPRSHACSATRPTGRTSHRCCRARSAHRPRPLQPRSQPTIDANASRATRPPRPRGRARVPTRRPRTDWLPRPYLSLPSGPSPPRCVGLASARSATIPWGVRTAPAGSSQSLQRCGAAPCATRATRQGALRSQTWRRWRTRPSRLRSSSSRPPTHRHPPPPTPAGSRSSVARQRVLHPERLSGRGSIRRRVRSVASPLVISTETAAPRSSWASSGSDR